MIRARYMDTTRTLIEQGHYDEITDEMVDAVLAGLRRHIDEIDDRIDRLRVGAAVAGWEASGDLSQETADKPSEPVDLVQHRYHEHGDF